jgi:hypothetical protein
LGQLLQPWMVFEIGKKVTIVKNMVVHLAYGKAKAVPPASHCLNSNLSLIYLYCLYRDVSFGLDKDDQLSSIHQ